MSAGACGGQGIVAVFGVGSVNGDQGGHKGCAPARRPVNSADISFAGWNAGRQTLVCGSFWPASKAFLRGTGAFLGSAGESGQRYLLRLKGGVQ